MKIQWLVGLRKDQISVSPGTLSEFQMVPGRVKLYFGAWNREVNVMCSLNLPDGVMGIPENWKDYFTLPDDVHYECYKDGFGLHLGPLVALIAFSKHEDITRSKLNSYREYFLQYGDGLLFICAADGIDTEKKMIKGYYYSTSGKFNVWKEGIFPYPGSAYNRTVLKKEVFDDLDVVMDNHIFNSFSNGSFNKWELWNRLSLNPTLKAHLPHTSLLTDLHSLDEMLDRNSCVYLKPVGGTLSMGIRKVCKRSDGDGYLLYYPNRQKEGNGTNQEILVDPIKIDRWLKRLQQLKYIVQQEITMKRYDERPIDFRVIMQKNRNNEWGCTGIFGKFGKKGSIITNFTKSGFLLSGKESFRVAFEMNEQQASKKIEELTQISHLICKTFDQYGLYGDVGIDLMVDQNGKVWILEVNTLDTNHRFPLRIKDTELYKQVVKNPLEFAKFLAGFTRDSKMKNDK
jgi:hypothetical protein